MTKRRRCAWLGILAVAWARTVLAGEPATQDATQPTTEPTPQVVALVDELGSEQFAVRQKAQQDLEEMGQPALPQLQEILTRPLADETRTRIRAAMRRIGDNREYGASIITLHCKGAPLEGVLEDFARQANAEMGIHRPEIRDYVRSHTVTLDLQKADFWTALQAVEDASGLHMHADNAGRLILDIPMFGWGPAINRSYSRIVGPCLIAPESESLNMRFDKPGANASNLNLQLMAWIEPKLHVVGYFQPNWLRECVDDKGHSLISPDMPGGFFGGSPQQMGIPFSANLRVVPGLGSEIARLKGQLDYDVLIKSETISVEDITLAKNVVKTVAGSSITVESFGSVEGRYELHLTIVGPLGAPNSLFLQNALSSRLEILDENDHPLQQMGCSFTNPGVDRAALVILYATNSSFFAPGGRGGMVGAPKRLRFEVPTEMRHMSQPFELDHLPLLHAPDAESN